MTDTNHPNPDEMVYFGALITKMEDQEDGSVVVQGRPTDEVLDMDKQIADPTWFRKALPEWYKWGNIREMHGKNAVGRATKLEWDADQDPWVTAKIVDPVAITKVREGVYKGFSIGVLWPEIRHDNQARRGRIVGGEIAELSLVDRPSVPTAKIQIVKRAGVDEWVDLQTGDHLDKLGNVRPDTASNSGDFDSLGNPVLQPGHVQANPDNVTFIAMDNRGVVLALDGAEYVVPYTVNRAGDVEMGDPELLPRDPKARTANQDPREHNETYFPGQAPKEDKATGDTRGATVEEEGLNKRDFDRSVGDGGVDRDKLPESDFIDPERRRFPIVAPKDVHDAVDSYGQAKPPIPYEHFKERLTEIAKRKGEAFVAELPKEWKEAEKGGKSMNQETAAMLQKRAQEAVEKQSYCPTCRKSVEVGDKVHEEHGEGGNHVTYKGACGHMVKRFEADSTEGRPDSEKTDEDRQKEAEEKAAAEKAAMEKGVPSGMGPEAGTVTGNAQGVATAANAYSSMANNIVGQLRGLLDDFDRMQMQKSPPMGEGSRLLAAIKQKVDALVSNAQWEQVEGGEKAVTPVLLKAATLLGSHPEMLVKSADQPKKTKKEEFKEVVKSLSDEVDKMPDDDESVEKAMSLGAHANPKGGVGGPEAPELSFVQRIREGVSALTDLARRLDASESWMPKGGTGEGNLGEDNKVLPPSDKPAGPTWDQRTSDADPHGGTQVDEMHKAAGASFDMQELAKTFGSAVQETLAPLVQQVQTIAHMAAPARPPVQVAEMSNEFGNPNYRVRDELTKNYKGEWNNMNPRQQEDWATYLVSAARKNQLIGGR